MTIHLDYQIWYNFLNHSIKGMQNFTSNYFSRSLGEMENYILYDISDIGKLDWDNDKITNVNINLKYY